MKDKWVVITLFSLTLLFCMSFAAAADPTSNQYAVADLKNTSQYTINTNNIKQTSTQMAAGETTNKTTNFTTEPVTPISITQKQLQSAASSVKNFYTKNGRLPNYVTISGNQISMPQYLELIAQGTLDIKNCQNLKLILKDVDVPKSPSVTVNSGQIKNAEYNNMALKILSFMDNNGRAPNYIASSQGKIGYEALVYMFSKIVAFHKDNNRLPNYVTVEPTINLAAGSNSSLDQYLATTKNCQVSSTTIKNLSNKITAGKTSKYAKAKAIFNWVRDHLSYKYYINTKKGALGALSSRVANCCDTTHLVIALARAAGIPGRYQYGTCNFSSGWFGHVWAQLYVNGKWYYADAASNSNTFGTIKNWSLNTVKIHRTYASLPF